MASASLITDYPLPHIMVVEELPWEHPDFVRCSRMTADNVLAVAKDLQPSGYSPYEYICKTSMHPLPFLFSFFFFNYLDRFVQLIHSKFY